MCFLFFCLSKKFLSTQRDLHFQQAGYLFPLFVGTAKP